MRDGPLHHTDMRTVSAGSGDISTLKKLGNPCSWAGELREAPQIQVSCGRSSVGVAGQDSRMRLINRRVGSGQTRRLLLDPEALAQTPGRSGADSCPRRSQPPRANGAHLQREALLAAPGVPCKIQQKKRDLCRLRRAARAAELFPCSAPSPCGLRAPSLPGTALLGAGWLRPREPGAAAAAAAAAAGLSGCARAGPGGRERAREAGPRALGEASGGKETGLAAAVLRPAPAAECCF
ncbi:hypothetical protein NDU88_012250 [Pleurodeles waltl]|uniref:Uncharacterized protein n=1 Tax=Pleurodeles waltl TaxID=8319 RepID=A0AAV7R2Q4_PLEWA|nr:hypothetical protein NDU88_012250 [Pleurodeles waltl]